ncbi:MAG: MFS transporter [Acetobacteraceae bacterium]|nr:MFS transporter [Acetobacteraceae bacterium]
MSRILNFSLDASPARVNGARPLRTLVLAGCAHALHDGYTDLIYVLLPVWQAEFKLSYGLLAVLRGVYTGTMAGLQIPAGRLAERLGGSVVLGVGTALAAFGYALAGSSGGLLGLIAGLALSGAGSSTQHPIASAAVARAYRGAARGPLGTYNFTGDLGKAALPALIAVLLTLMPWRGALWLLSGLGLMVAAAIALLLPPVGRPQPLMYSQDVKQAAAGRGFLLLFAIGVLDSAVRMGLLTFLPFLLKSKGAALPTVGLGLALVFMGGAAGKFAFGWLGARIGVLGTVLLTEGGTAAAILGILDLPLAPSLMVLPALGVMLNGTSSVLYGTVPELAAPGRAERAFAIFYTGTIGSGAVAPVFYGVLGDAVGVGWATAATALTALATIPLALALAPRLGGDRR